MTKESNFALSLLISNIVLWIRWHVENSLSKWTRTFLHMPPSWLLFIILVTELLQASQFSLLNRLVAQTRL